MPNPIKTLAQLIVAQLAPSFQALSDKLDKALVLLGTIKDFIGAETTEPQGAAVELQIFVRNFPGQKITLIGDSMLVVTDVQKVTLSIAPVDAKGNPAPVDGVPTWAVSDATLATITPAADGLSAVVTASGPLGTFQANVSADADLGAGTTTITGTLDIQVTASQATSLNIAAGTPEPA